MKNSKFLSLNLSDLGKGLVVAVVVAVLVGLNASLNAAVPHFPTVEEFKQIEISGAAAAVAYLLKNLFTNSSNQLAKKD